MTRKLIVSVALAVIVLAIATYLYIDAHREHLPPDMVAAADVRQAVAGKTASDASKIVIEPGPLYTEPFVVTKKDDMAAMLAGLQVAVRTKVQRGCSGPRFRIVWEDGSETRWFYVYPHMGPKQAFGEKFATAYNKVVPSELRVTNRSH